MIRQAFDILEWREGDSTALVRLIDIYSEKWVQVSDYPESRSGLIIGDAFRYFARNGWEPLSVHPVKVGWFWGRTVNNWIFIRNK